MTDLPETLAEHVRQQVDEFAAEVERQIEAQKAPSRSRGIPGPLERAVFNDAAALVRAVRAEWQGGDRDG